MQSLTEKQFYRSTIFNFFEGIVFIDDNNDIDVRNIEINDFDEGDINDGYFDDDDWEDTEDAYL